MPGDFPRRLLRGPFSRCLSSDPSGRPPTIGVHIAKRLRQCGVDTVFGVPGDYSLGLADELIRGGLRWEGTCNELNAGYAADGYARMRGCSAACVTYGVGGFSILNAVAGGHAEMVPMVVISGGLSRKEYGRGNPVFSHHSLMGRPHAQRTAFEPATVAAVELLDPLAAAAEVDDAIARCLNESRPVLIEVPSDVARLPCHAGSHEAPWDALFHRRGPPPFGPAVDAAAAQVAELLLAAKRPAVLVGVEVHRRRAQDSLARLARALGVPIASTRHGKTAADDADDHAGVYAGALSPMPTRLYVEESDVLCSLGAMPTDFEFATSRLLQDEPGEGQPPIRVFAYDGWVTVISEAEGSRVHSGVPLEPFVRNLASRVTEGVARAPRDGLDTSAGWTAAQAQRDRRTTSPPLARAGEPTTTAFAIEALGGWIRRQPGAVGIVADAGDALLSTTDLPLRAGDKVRTPGPTAERSSARDGSPPPPRPRAASFCRRGSTRASATRCPRESGQLSPQPRARLHPCSASQWWSVTALSR